MRKGAKTYQEATGFIMYFDSRFRMIQNVVLRTVFDVLPSRKTVSSFTEKTNAFLILSGAFLRKGPKKDQETTGFIMYSDQLFRVLQKVVLLTVFDVLPNRESA